MLTDILLCAQEHSSVLWQPYVLQVCTVKPVVGCYVFSIGDTAWLFTFCQFSNGILLCLLPGLLLLFVCCSS